MMHNDTGNVIANFICRKDSYQHLLRQTSPSELADVRSKWRGNSIQPLGHCQQSQVRLLMSTCNSVHYFLYLGTLSCQCVNHVTQKAQKVIENALLMG